VQKVLTEQHLPVMVKEVFELLSPALADEDSVLVDCTLGLGGHSEYFLKNLNKIKVIGFDQDAIALTRAKERLSAYKNRVVFVSKNFNQLKNEIEKINLQKVNAIIFDLGVSSIQIDEKERGFSYLASDPLDMRMNQSQSLNAEVIVNTWDEQDIAKILFEYGEEKFAKKIAKNIINKRNRSLIHTTAELVEIINNSIPAPARRTGGNPAKKTFQALRIAVNQELDVLKEALTQAIDSIAPGGRIAVLTYHSLEDRIVKQFFKSLIRVSDIPREIPVIESVEQDFKLITNKPLRPTEAEIAFNSRSKSAKLRGIERLARAA
jgi:16S rRNA (cytosine1402-N4)-methyltransferase